MAGSSFKYDLAFSFAFADEPLAVQLNELLKPTLRTFIYTEHQKDLIARDGVDAFSQVYRHDARTVAVLLGPGWGNSKWTRVEENAVKSRAFDAGYEFATFVQIDPSVPMPAWLPPTQLYASFSRWGIDALAAHLERHAEKLGAAVREETIAEKAERNIRAAAAREKRRLFERSDDGVVRSKAAAAEFRVRLEKAFEEARDAGYAFLLKEYHGRYFTVMRPDGLSLVSYFDHHYANSLEGSRLRCIFSRGMPRLSGLPQSFEEPLPVAELTGLPDLSPGDAVGFRADGRHYAPAAFADMIAGRFMDTPPMEDLWHGR